MLGSRRRGSLKDPLTPVLTSRHTVIVHPSGRGAGPAECLADYPRGIFVKD